jgi:hypothetical protein
MEFDTPEALLQKPNSIFTQMAMATGDSQIEHLVQCVVSQGIKT